MAKSRKSSKDLDPSLVREFLDYNPDTGLFIRKPVPEAHRNSDKHAAFIDRLYAGTSALSVVLKNGYLSGTIKGYRVYAHRAAYACMTGRWPEKMIDHINGIKADNRWANLRCADSQTNSFNSKPRANVCGFKGVKRARKRYSASLTINGKAVWIGVFDSPEEAHDAYVKASHEHHKEYSYYAGLNKEKEK